ncbi:AraC family transcriptional regulator [Coraliomargarita sp. SDUM461004]|uniref:AraC family transcriptional regulator n=1 Tax=Thalassobacterium sedimentorum TaxID=3041258 RepID=A0ABU1AQM8_9BACT|nr:AraC family transcriptional regulator [Coraliomargarita sp. SDUM461004]MDQ8196071.1 AraC family transcriptional regulator [Coraliomargarita sp. SDUM461004]
MDDIISCGHLKIGDLGLHKNRGMELTYVSRGRMEWVVDGRIEVVQQGDIFFTLPWQLHGSPVLEQPVNEAWHLLFTIPGDYTKPRRSINFPKSLGLTREESVQMSRVFCNATRNAWRASPHIKKLFPWMVEELESRRALSRANGFSLLRVILVELSRLIVSEPETVMEALDSERRVRAFLDVLYERCDEEWTLQQMSECCQVQRTRLSELVRQFTAYSPMTYLTRLRVARARNLLRNSENTITEIALSCGFSSSQYFANVFRRCVGQTPSAYREGYEDLYQLEVDSRSIPWRTLKQERERVAEFRIR